MKLVKKVKMFCIALMSLLAPNLCFGESLPDDSGSVISLYLCMQRLYY